MDDKIRDGLEKLSNGMSRRRFLQTAGKGIFATLATIALGQFNQKEVFAGCGSGLLCCDPAGKICPGCPHCGGGPSCPSGYVLCTSGSGCGYCWYTSGSWTCNGGSVTCYDCFVYGNCSSACTCPVTIYTAPQP